MCHCSAVQIDPAGLNPNQVSLSCSVCLLTCQLLLSSLLFIAFCLAYTDYIAIMVQPVVPFYQCGCFFARMSLAGWPVCQSFSVYMWLWYIMAIHLLSVVRNRRVSVCFSFLLACLITYMCHFVDVVGFYVCSCVIWVLVSLYVCACGGSTGAPVPLRAHLFCTLCPVN